MGSRYELEVKLASARNLKNVNWRHGPNKPYVVVWVDPSNKLSTHIDENGDTDANWDETLIIPLPAKRLEDLTLYIDVVHAGSEEDTKPLIGSARLKLTDVLNDVGFSERASRTLKLKRPSGRPQGKVDVKVAVREPSYRAPGGYSAAPYGVPPQSRDYSAAPPAHGYPYGAQQQAILKAAAQVFDKSAKFYAIWTGTEPGVYDEWAQVTKLIGKEKNHRFQKFSTFEKAIQAVLSNVDRAKVSLHFSPRLTKAAEKYFLEIDAYHQNIATTPENIEPTVPAFAPSSLMMKQLKEQIKTLESELAKARSQIPPAGSMEKNIEEIKTLCISQADEICRLHQDIKSEQKKIADEERQRDSEALQKILKSIKDVKIAIKGYDSDIESIEDRL